MKLNRHKIQAPIILSFDSTDIKLLCQIATRISKLTLDTLSWTGDNSQTITSLQMTSQCAG